MDMRTTKPGAGNKYYIRKAQGGYSNAIPGYPTDKECNVLSNCVGYAYGRFNEIGGYGYCKYLAPVNAENFMDYKGSCQTGMTPKPGAVMVWEGKGSLAGHVAIVERVDSDTQVLTSESGYGSSAFWTQTRKKGSGNWGAGSNYVFKGFIYNPAVKEEAPKPAPKPSKTVDQLAKEVINGDWGNGEDRKRRLTAAGYNYGEVQARVNQMLAPAAPSYEVYTVRSGDTLTRISQRYFGTSSKWQKIYNDNKSTIGPNPNLIYPGQKLKIYK